MSQGRQKNRPPAIRADKASDPERSDAAEEKRRAARRRFLLGGASALPVIVSVTAVRATVVIAPESTCTSLGGVEITPVPPMKPPPGPSLVCEIP